MLIQIGTTAYPLSRIESVQIRGGECVVFIESRENAVVATGDDADAIRSLVHRAPAQLQQPTRDGNNGKQANKTKGGPKG